MSIRERAARLMLVGATTVGATFTILVAGGSGSLEAQPVRIIYIGMAALALIPWFVGAIVRPSWRPSSRLMLPIGAILVAYAISTVTSRNQRISLEMLGYAVLLFLVYLLLVTLMRRTAIRGHFERLGLLFCLLVPILYVLQVSLAWIEWWGLVGRVTVPPLRPSYAGLTLGSPNPVATLVLLLGAFSLATTDLRRRAGRVLGVVLTTLVLVAVFLSGSRGAWLGGAVALMATTAVVAGLRPDIRGRAGEIGRSRWGLATIAVGVPLVAIATALAAITGRLTIDDGGYRAGFARASAEMFQTSPVTGVGPGMWGVLRAQSSLSDDVDLYIPHAHNIYVQTLAEFGVLGAVAGAVLVAFLALLIWRAIRSADRSRQLASTAALFALVLLATQQIADVLVNVPAVLLAAALPIAWLDAAEPRTVEVSASGQVRISAIDARYPLLAAAIGTALIIAGLGRIEVLANTARQAVAEADAGRWDEATALFYEVASADPDVAAYQFQLGVSAANAGDLRLAEEALGRSAAADDYTYAWLDLAAVRWQLGDVIEAHEAIVRAERFGLRRESIAVAAGWLRQQAHDNDAAIADYAAALMLNPALSTDPFWSSPDGPPGGLAAVLAYVEEQASRVTLLHLYLVQGRFEDALAQAGSLAESDPDLYGNIVPAWRGDGTARTKLENVASTRALDPLPATWLRHITGHLGDEASVRKYDAWLAILSSDESVRPELARIEFGSPQRLPSRFLDRYGSIYRRNVVDAQVVAPLPQLAAPDDS